MLRMYGWDSLIIHIKVMERIMWWPSMLTTPYYVLTVDPNIILWFTFMIVTVNKEHNLRYYILSISCLYNLVWAKPSRGLFSGADRKI